MEPLIRKEFGPFLPFLITFAGFGLIGGVVVRDPDFVVAMAIMLQCWASGPVLFTDTSESDAFLRTLPITRRELLASRFWCSLIELAFCWIIMLVVAAMTARTLADFGALVEITAIAAAGSLLVAGACHVWVAKSGASIPLGIVMNVLAIGATLFFVTSFSGYEELANLDGAASPPIAAILAVPWPIHALVFAGSIWAFFSLLRVAVDRGRTPTCASG